MLIRPLVVIPTKDNVFTVSQVAHECSQFVSDILIVNDGSTDGTGQVLSTLGDAFSVVTHPTNKGKGAALATALQWAKSHGFSHVVAIDADGQHFPSDLPHFLAALKNDPYAIHIGVRDMTTAPKSSRFGRRFSNFWIWVETGHRVGDSQTGYRVYPVDPVLQLKLPKGRYEWEVAVLTLALWAGIAVRDVPCQVYYPPPEERVSSFRPFFDNVRISLLNCRLVAGRILWPPRWINRVPEPGGVWRGQHLGRTWGWRFFFILLRILGRTPAHLCMACMATFYFLIASSHRRGVLTYAIRVRPKSSRAGRLWLTWRVFFRFACSLIDRFHMMAKGPQALSVDSRGSEAARETMHTEGGILMASHMGNADLAGMVLGTTNKVRRVHQVQYTSTHDPYLTLMNQVLDPDKRPVIISLNDQMGLAGLTITQALRDGHIVAMKGDRVIDDRTVKVKFLGEDISFPAGPFLVAALTRVPVVTMGCFAEGKGYRLLTTGPKTYAFTSRKNRDADLQGWVQDYALTLETWARRYPDQWYNFHDIWT